MSKSHAAEDPDGPGDLPEAAGIPSGGADGPPIGIHFLLAQLGAHAAEQFAARVAALGLTPPQAGLLRALAARPGLSQQALAQHLRTQPSRVVTLVDDLEGRGLVERRLDPRDRRLHALHLTPDGQELLRQIGQVAMQHEDAICAPLDHDERSQLRSLLERLRVHHGLTAGVHPGYRHLR